MDTDLLLKHINVFHKKSSSNSSEFQQHWKERIETVSYYRSFTKERITTMNEVDLFEFISKLWAMLIWGNKRYVVDKLIEDNGLDNIKVNLINLLYGEANIELRWDSFRRNIKGMGPAMISEILCKTNPNEYILWNRRAYVALNYLSVKKLPKYDYQFTGKMYTYLCEIGKQISCELQKRGFEDYSLLAVDYFIWDQLQVQPNLSDIFTIKEDGEKKISLDTIPQEINNFIHDDVKEKLRDIGQWLGFTSQTEQKVSQGSKIDTIWEATIGNMGRVIYIFEVQTKGSIDSLILNLLKSLNNAAVQGVVAVSDKQQLEKIKHHVADVPQLKEKLKYWDYEEVLKIHAGLEFINESINKLGLVPQGF